MDSYKVQETIRHMEKSLSQLEKVQENYLKNMEDILEQFRVNFSDVYLAIKPAYTAIHGTECRSTFDVVTQKTVGETVHWARPRIDKHTKELYTEIFSWCETTFKSDMWKCDFEDQMYFFDRIEDRDWFLIKWA